MKSNHSNDDQHILDSFEKGEWKSVEDVAQKKNKYQKLAADSQKKTKTITIRISESDLLDLKAKAYREGLPYQTMISSTLHKLAKQ